MKVQEPSSGDVEFTIKQTWRGLVVMKRGAVPLDFVGCWSWGKWRKATIADLPFILHRLQEEMK